MVFVQVVIIYNNMYLRWVQNCIVLLTLKCNIKESNTYTAYNTTIHMTSNYSKDTREVR